MTQDKGWKLPRNKKLYIVILVVVAGLGWFYMDMDKGPKEVGPVIGYRAPDFVVKDMMGNEASLSGQRGKPVFINFFATWCTFCRVEMPHIEALYRELGDEIEFMVVDLMESKETVEAFFQSQGLTVPVYLDTKGASGHSYEVRGIPASFFVDRKGVIQDVALGALTEARLRQALGKIHH